MIRVLSHFFLFLLECCILIFFCNTSTMMLQEFFNKGFRMNQNTLKYLLNQMKKENIIKNDRSHGGWYLIEGKRLMYKEPLSSET